MKIKAATGVIATAIALPALTHAQSSVEIYGVIDLGIQRADNGVSSLTSVITNGNPWGSRLGFRGVEDLGGGLKAKFILETGFNPDTGASSDSTRFFNRVSILGLQGNWGEFRIGRDYTPTFNQWGSFEPYAGNGVGTIAKLLPALSNQGTIFRADNSIAYRLPGDLGGVYGDVMFAANESTTATATGNKYNGGRLGYASGPWNTSIAYAQTSVARLYNGDSVKETFLSGSYDFNVIKVGANLAQRTLGDLTLKTAQLILTAPVGDGVIKATAARLHSNVGSSAAANQLTLGYVHSLSKRTIVYSTIARVNNGDTAAYAAGNIAAVTGRDYTGYEVGLRTSF